jgi:hypothetical protein
MDAQKLQFMLSIQLEIDKLEAKLGSNHNEVIAIKELFQKLSQSELRKENQDKVISESNIELLNIKLDTKSIRSHLEIRANPSIDYEFIEEERVKKQLIADNKRMENIRLNPNFTELERFYNFCLTAFFQIEELVNYYFGKKYNYESFLKLMAEKNPKRKYFQKNFSEVPIADKIYVFEGLFYFNKFLDNGARMQYESVINLIKDIRNEDLHRCNIIEQDNGEIEQKYIELQKRIADFKINRESFDILYPKTEEEMEIEKLGKKQGRLIKFVKEKNYNLVRDTIIDLTHIIKNNINSNKL